MSWKKCQENDHAHAHALALDHVRVPEGDVAKFTNIAVHEVAIVAISRTLANYLLWCADVDHDHDHDQGLVDVIE